MAYAPVRVTGLMTLALAFHAAAALAGVWSARAHREHRPIAAFLTLTAVADVLHVALKDLVLLPEHARLGAAPFTGAARAAGHLDQALWLTWPAGLAALALVTFGKRRPWPAAVAWFAVLAALILGYPALRGPALQRVYLACELAAVLVGVRYAAAWVRHAARRDGAERLTRGEPVAVACAMVLVAVDISGVFFGAWRGSIFLDWHLSQVAYSVEYAVLIALQLGGVLWSQGSKSSSSRSDR